MFKTLFLQAVYAIHSLSFSVETWWIIDSLFHRPSTFSLHFTLSTRFTHILWKASNLYQTKLLPNLGYLPLQVRLLGDEPLYLLAGVHHRGVIAPAE